MTGRMDFVEVNYVPAFEEYEFEYVVYASAVSDPEVVSANEKRKEDVIRKGSHGVYGEFSCANDEKSVL